MGGIFLWEGYNVEGSSYGRERSGRYDPGGLCVIRTSGAIKDHGSFRTSPVKRTDLN